MILPCIILLYAGCGNAYVNSNIAANPAPLKKDSLVKTVAPAVMPIEDSIYLTSPTLSTLHGKLIQKLCYGIPGFGMNPKEDAQYTWFFLVLNKPISLYANPKSEFNIENMEKPIQGIDSIQIREERENKQLLSRVGKQVTIIGSINVSVLPSEQPPAIIEFKEVK